MIFIVRRITPRPDVIRAEASRLGATISMDEDYQPVVLRVSSEESLDDAILRYAENEGLAVLSGKEGALVIGSSQRCEWWAGRLASSYKDLSRQIRNVLRMNIPGVLYARDKTIELGSRTLVMGIVNISPDSFSGDGLEDISAAVSRVETFLDQGADIIDIGAMSTRPGSDPIPEEEEASRLKDLISRIRPMTDVPISADTYRLGPAQAALEAGADIINDVSGLRDPEMAKLVAAYEAGVVVMHMKGTPKDMQDNPQYEDLIGEIYSELEAGVSRALDSGVRRESIIIDPGIGFGKTIEHNLEIIARLGEFKSMGYPVLVGTSRKGFIGRITGKDPQERKFGTAATVALSVAAGADIVRVHDVEQMLDVCLVADAIVRREFL